MNTHLHITSWVLAFILFAVAIVLHKKGNAKAGKIVQMILRLDYLLILYSGGELIGAYIANATGAALGESIVKGLAGFWAIIAMEMIGVKTAKDKPTKGWWIQFVIAVLLTLILGFGRLGYGLLP